MSRDWNAIMFDNIGEKIKKVAKVIAWTEIVLSIIGGVIMLIGGFSNVFDGYSDAWIIVLLSPVAVVVGCICAWLSVITLYGLGELIVKMSKNEENTRMILRTMQYNNSRSQESGRTEKANPTVPQVQPVKEKQEIVGNASKSVRHQEYWVCGNCKTKNLNSRTDCWSCGRAFEK